MIESDESDDTLDRVIEGLRLADRFEIHVVACGDLEQVERAQAQLARALGDRAVSVDVAVTDLGSPEALITRLLEATTRGVLVLVATVMDDEFGQWSLVFQRLNEARNRLKERFDGLVLLLLAPLKPVFLHNAQDFFSWRSASIEVPGRVDAPHDDWASYDDRASYEEPEEPEESPVTTEARPAPPVLPSDAPLPSVAQPEVPVARAITGRWAPLHDRVEDEAEDEDEADEPDARPKGLGASESSLMTILPSLEELVAADDVLSTDLDLDLGPSPELESASRVTSVPSVMPAAAKPATRPEAKSTPRPSKRPDLGPTPNHARKQAPEHPKAAPARTVAGSTAPPPLAPPAVEPAFDEVGKGVVPKPKAKPTPASKPSAATSSEPARPASAMVPNQSATPPTQAPTPAPGPPGGAGPSHDARPRPEPEPPAAPSWSPRLGEVLERLWRRLAGRRGGRGLDPRQPPLRVLLLSGLRAPGLRGSRPLEARMRWLTEDLEQLCGKEHPPRFDLVVVAGDVAMHGHGAELEHARRLLRHLVVHLSEGASRPSLLLVPGNHDIDKEPAPWKTLLHSSAQLDRTMTLRNNIATAREGARGFRHLVQQLHDDGLVPCTPAYQPHLLLTHELEHGRRRVALRGLDSAFSLPWVGHGMGVLGSPQLEAALAGLDDADLRIAVVHHPPDMMDPNEWAVLRRTFDLVLTGPGSSASPVQRSGDRAVLVTGPGLLGRSTAEHPAGYAVLELSDVARVWLRWVGASSQPEPEVLPLGPSPASP